LREKNEGSGDSHFIKDTEPKLSLFYFQVKTGNSYLKKGGESKDGGKTD
jgi:hypothetical protein